MFPETFKCPKCRTEYSSINAICPNCGAAKPPHNQRVAQIIRFKDGVLRCSYCEQALSSSNYSQCPCCHTTLSKMSLVRKEDTIRNHDSGIYYRNYNHAYGRKTSMDNMSRLFLSIMGILAGLVIIMLAYIGITSKDQPKSLTAVSTDGSTAQNAQNKEYSDDRNAATNTFNIDPTKTLTKTYSVVSYTDLFSYSIEVTFYNDVYAYFHALPRYYKFEEYNHYINEKHNQELVKQLATTFALFKDKYHYTDSDVVREIVNFVQSIVYVKDSVTAGQTEWPKYPIETLYEQNGDCEDTSVLLAAILKEMNYGVALLYLPKHMAVGVQGSDNMQGSYYLYNGIRYFYVETTAKGWEIGQLPPQFQNTQVKLLIIN